MFHDRLVEALRADLGREPTVDDIVGDGESPPAWVIAYRDEMLARISEPAVRQRLVSELLLGRSDD